MRRWRDEEAGSMERRRERPRVREEEEGGKGVVGE